MSIWGPSSTGNKQDYGCYSRFATEMHQSNALMVCAELSTLHVAVTACLGFCEQIHHTLSAKCLSLTCSLQHKIAFMLSQEYAAWDACTDTGVG